jgi:hypothetical protein
MGGRRPACIRRDAAAAACAQRALKCVLVIEGTAVRQPAQLMPGSVAVEKQV